MNYKVIAFALSLGVLAGCRDRCCNKPCKEPCETTECSTKTCKADTKATKKMASRESGPLSDKTVAWDDADYGKHKKENYNVA